MRRIAKSVLFAAFLGVVAGCASSQINLSAMSPDQLFERGITLLNEGEWSDAIIAFEQFVIQHPTHPRVQEARFRLGEAYYGKKEFITAANEFSRLANDYPAGPFADDARFKVCESYYRLSPKIQLDQQYSRSAYEHCESLIAYFPTSEFVPRAREIMAEMRNKLAAKDFIAAEHYFKRNAYDSAIIYYEAIARDFADTVYAPRALARLVETYRILGYQEEQQQMRDRLLRDFPDSPEARALQQSSAPSNQ